MQHRCFVLALVSVSALVLAQGPTFVVDAGNGPGTNYTDLQTAVSAVPDGSVLLVRPGVYAPVAVDAKTLTVLGGTGVDVGTSFAIANLAPTQKVAVRGVRVVGATPGIRVDDALGAVSWDGSGTGVSSLRIVNSRQVHVRSLNVAGVSVAGVPHTAPCSVAANSSAVLEQCTLIGLGLGSLEFSQACSPALTVMQSEVQLVDTMVVGGNGGSAWAPFAGWITVPGAPAVWLATGALRALGTQPISGGQGAVQAPAIDGTGTARVAPAIALGSQPGASVSLTRPSMPRLTADNPPPGGSITVTHSAPAGWLCAIAVSLRGPATSVPGLADPLWAQAASLVVEAVAVVPAAGSVVTQKPVPALPALLGFEMVWQAADFDTTGQLSLTNPSPSLIR